MLTELLTLIVAAQRADIDLPFERAAAIDLAGRDVLEAVQMSVNPKVIETPFIAGVAMNGIEVKAKLVSQLELILLDLLVVLVKKQSSHVLVKVSFQQLVLVSIIQKYLKTQIIFLKQF
ncbi:exported protein [Staphylococcus aureus]|nr:exported protein [Staphylococcus aureus]